MLQFCPTELEHLPTILGLLCNKFRKGLMLAISKPDNKSHGEQERKRLIWSSRVGIHAGIRYFQKNYCPRLLQTTNGGSSG